MHRIYELSGYEVDVHDIKQTMSHAPSPQLIDRVVVAIVLETLHPSGSRSCQKLQQGEELYYLLLHLDLWR